MYSLAQIGFPDDCVLELNFSVALLKFLTNLGVGHRGAGRNQIP